MARSSSRTVPPGNTYALGNAGERAWRRTMNVSSPEGVSRTRMTEALGLASTTLRAPSVLRERRPPGGRQGRHVAQAGGLSAIVAAVAHGGKCAGNGPLGRRPLEKLERLASIDLTLGEHAHVPAVP